MRRLSLFAAFIAGALLSLPSALRAQGSESRYNKELVFPLYMKNVSLGASPVILHGFMLRGRDAAGLSVTLPPVHFMFEQCFWDMGNAGSLGWGVFVSYGKYKYSYAGSNGYGGNVVNVRAGMLQPLAGLSYHYTIRTRLEVYARMMLGFSATGFRSDRAGDIADWDSQFIWNGVAGVRWFFSNSFGVYAEGGHTSGLINAGITYRW